MSRWLIIAGGCCSGRLRCGGGGAVVAARSARVPVTRRPPIRSCAGCATSSRRSRSPPACPCRGSTCCDARARHQRLRRRLSRRPTRRSRSPRGALDQLNRDELQGVIAHEFSHILNGDMRLNIRLIGLLFGILLLAHDRARSPRSIGGRGDATARAALPIVVVGAGDRWSSATSACSSRDVIKAAVSRQRESLADASAVQFTRQTDGLAGALKKIGGLADGLAAATIAATPRKSPHAVRRGHRAFHVAVRDASATARADQGAQPQLQPRRNRCSCNSVTPTRPPTASPRHRRGLRTCRIGARPSGAEPRCRSPRLAPRPVDMRSPRSKSLPVRARSPRPT